MPRLSRLAVRIALLWLALGLALGVVVALGRTGAAGPAVLVLGPVALHALVVGWLTQLIFGVAIWLFPRGPGDRGRKLPSSLVTGLVLLNVGLLLRALSEPALTLGAAVDLAAPGLAVAAGAQAAGILLFAAHLWRRVEAR